MSIDILLHNNPQHHHLQNPLINLIKILNREGILPLADFDCIRRAVKV